ncbi:MAG: hypothetical protein PHC84_01725 [Clostridia bacterium]|nr:hypothetical protein [Clostridia bacterium]
MRKFSLFVLIVMTACAVAVTAVIIHQELNKDTSTLALLRTEDISLPEGLKEDEFGLFFFDGEGNKHRSTADAPFDANKPVVILSYALMQGIEDSGEDIYSAWQCAGYNVGILIWNQLSEDDGAAVEQKIWSSGGRFLERKSRIMYSRHRLEYSVTECMTAYYLDFMTRNGFCGSEIRFVGHSVGGQLVAAVASYLLALEKAAYIGEEYLPDRMTLLDCYLTNNLSDKYISWLEKNIEGTVFCVADAVRELRAKGAAVEYVRSSFIDMFTETGAGAKGGFDLLIAEAAFLELRSDWLNYQSGSMLSDLAPKHLFSRLWYQNALNEPLPPDYASGMTLQYAVSPITPSIYMCARAGTKYAMYVNMTESGEDDRQFSMNSRVPLVSGCAFFDRDGDGRLDERLKDRIDGVKVELYLIEEGEDTLITSTTTKNGGFYQLPIEPIYIFNTEGKEFYIAIKVMEGYNITVKGGASNILTNGIKTNKKSDSFFLYNKEQLKIINIGLTR